MRLHVHVAMAFANLAIALPAGVDNHSLSILPDNPTQGSTGVVDFALVAPTSSSTTADVTIPIIPTATPSFILIHPIFPHSTAEMSTLQVTTETPFKWINPIFESATSGEVSIVVESLNTYKAAAVTDSDARSNWLHPVPTSETRCHCVQPDPVAVTKWPQPTEHSETSQVA